MVFNTKKFLLELIGISIVLLLLILIPIYLFSGVNRSSEIILGYVVSLLIFILGFISINWAFNKSLKIFMAIVLGGMFFRFILIAMALFLFIRFTDIHILYFILSFVIFYLIYQVYEIRFINMRLSKGKKWLRYTREAS